MNSTPVVFIHGAWFHALSWEAWADRFTGRGFTVWAPGWPGEPDTVGEARRRPEVLRGLGLDALTDHFGRLAASFDEPPVLIGHSVGGLVVQHLLGHGLGRAAVAVAPAPVADVPPQADRSPRWAPEADGDPAVPLSPEEFRDVFANTVGAEESARLYDRYVVPAPRRLLTDLGHDGPDAHPRAVADVRNTTRGPLLLISGQEDRVVPDSLTRAAYKLYGDSVAVSDLKQFADRGHTLTVDNGWRAVADHVLDWLAEQGIHAGGTRR